MKNISIIELAWELHESRVSTEDIALRIGHHRATVYRWFKGIKLYGIREYLRRYQQAKKGRRQKRKTNPIIKARIYAIRDKYSNCCGEKIRYWMFKEYGIKISISTIYRILGQKYQLRSKWKKNEVRGPIPKASKQREVIQHDTVDFGELFAFTSVDIFTKEAQVVIRPRLEAIDGAQALKRQMQYFKFADLLQRTVDDALGDRLLARFHDDVHELGKVNIAKFWVRENFTFRDFATTWHFFTSLLQLAPLLAAPRELSNPHLLDRYKQFALGSLRLKHLPG